MLTPHNVIGTPGHAFPYMTTPTMNNQAEQLSTEIGPYHRYWHSYRWKNHSQIVTISYVWFWTQYCKLTFWFFQHSINWHENALSQHWPLTNFCVLTSWMFMIHNHGAILPDIWHLYKWFKSTSRCISWQELDSVWVNTWVRQAGSASTGNVVIPLPSPPDSNCSYTPINTLDITDTASHWSGSWLTCNPGFWLDQGCNRFWTGPRPHLLALPGLGRAAWALNNSWLLTTHFCTFLWKY